ncbi:MAG: conjugal transfer protein TraI [Chitinophagaceae bacterium]
MKKLFVIAALVLSFNSEAQIVEIIREGVKKAIIAVDLKIQRLQNKTIWLQNAQKTLENELSRLKLNEISDWVNKQKELYTGYFDELWKVKAAIANYRRVKDIIATQMAIVQEYKQAWTLFKLDKNFTTEELDHIHNVFTGILEKSLKDIDQLFIIVNAFATQMSDGKRMAIINSVSDEVETSYNDLRQFNQQNKMISLQRVSGKAEIETVKKLYGIQ